jgi:hypothetical protein
MKDNPYSSAGPRPTKKCFKRPEALIGGVMENDGVAIAAALYDALKSKEIGISLTDPLFTNLFYWEEDCIKLLQDLGLTFDEAEDVCNSLMFRSERIIPNRDKLTEQVGAILQANIDLARAF